MNKRLTLSLVIIALFTIVCGILVTSISIVTYLWQKGRSQPQLTTPTSARTIASQYFNTPEISKSPWSTNVKVTITQLPTILPTPTLDFRPLVFDMWCIPWNTIRTRGKAISVVDGITILVNIQGQTSLVRYLGIAIPEFTHDIEANTIKSIEANRDLTEGKEVLLIKNISERDEYNRLLRFVLVGPIFVNLKLIEDGYAIASSHPPDFACDMIFQQAEDYARSAQRGFWAPTLTPTRTATFTLTLTPSKTQPSTPSPSPSGTITPSTPTPIGTLLISTPTPSGTLPTATHTFTPPPPTASPSPYPSP